ncbi:MAG: DUF1778 domain-containing protein [Mailhella sp.]|nr:DUF1778 domain-containing protein [Mailhella sp.]
MAKFIQPKKKPEDRRSPVMIRFSAKEKAEVEAAAAKEQESLSAFVRGAALEKALDVMKSEPETREKDGLAARVDALEKRVSVLEEKQ